LPLTIRDFLADNREALGLRLVAGKSGSGAVLTDAEPRRPAFAGRKLEDVSPPVGVVLIGDEDYKHLSALSDAQRSRLLQGYIRPPLECIILAGEYARIAPIRPLANQRGIALIQTSLPGTEVLRTLFDYLARMLAPTEQIHGTLVDIHGTGVLFIGRAGIGKSEIALDLVERGHRLVADDVVILRRYSPGILIGSGPELLKHFLEIRGIGIIDVRKLFGVRAIRLQKRVETVVELLDWDGSEDYERLGLDERTIRFIGVDLPYVRLPIFPGKNITVLAEAIALGLHLKIYGESPAAELSSRQSELMRRRRIEGYLRSDPE